MARVTVEDCVQRVPNRFELVLLAARRARDIHAGASLTLDRDNDKNPVVALREIADETVELEALRYALEHSREVDVELDEPEEETLAMIAAEQAWAGVTGQSGAAAKEEPKDTVTETASTETASTETASTETVSTETASTETASTEAASTEAASTEDEVAAEAPERVQQEAPPGDLEES